MLTTGEAELFAACLVIARREANVQPGNHDYGLGRVVQAWDQARDSLQTALINAQCYGADVEAAHAIASYRERLAKIYYDEDQAIEEAEASRPTDAEAAAALDNPNARGFGAGDMG